MVCASASRIAVASMECVVAYACTIAAARILSVAYDCAAQATGGSPYVFAPVPHSYTNIQFSDGLVEDVLPYLTTPDGIDKRFNRVSALVENSL